MALSSIGIGSNLDIESIVSQLMSVERKPLAALATRETGYKAKLSGFGTLKGIVSQFQNAMRGLADPAKFQGMKIAAADLSVASATAASGASSTATPGTYTLEVSKLAQAQKMVATGIASDKTAIGDKNVTNTISFDFGTISGGSFDNPSGKYTGASFTSSGGGIKTVKIDASNNSLTGIRDAINSAGLGVTATIVNDGSASPYRLAITVNSTGKTNSLKISVDGDPAMAALLGHDPATNSGQGFSETASAQNAEFKIDGIAISKTTNTATDVVGGVNLTLNKTGGPTSITVSRDTASVTSSVTSFVTAYNNLAQALRDAGAYDPNTRTAAVLNGESALRTIQTRVRSMLNTPIAGGESAYNVLSQVGVAIEKDGLLTLDSAKLQKAIDKNFGAISSLFAKVGKSSDSLVSYTATTAKTKPGSYSVSIDQLARQASTTAVSPTHVPGKGSIVGSAAAALTIDGMNNTLDIVVDGQTVTASIAQGNYSDATALAAAVQTAINDAFSAASKSASVTVSQTDGMLKITSSTSGTSSSVEVTGGNGKTALLGSTPLVTAGSQASIASGANTLEVELDGTKATVTLAPGNYTYAELAAAIQTKINGTKEFVDAGSSAKVTDSGGVFTITSNRYGSASTASITGGSAKAALFGTPSLVTGLDVAGKINGVAATGSGQILTGAEGNDAEGLGVTVTGGSLGDRGTVTFTQGYAYQFERLAASLLSSEGLLAARTDGIDASLKSLEKTKQRLNDQLVATEKRYRAQFSALDAVISSMTQTSNYLAQQLASLSRTTD